LAGIIPLSAQIGNAISNDGDALFPAIAIAPKAAIVATLYSSVPAMVIAYAWLFMFE
ncbi:putative manganese transporter, partial [SAR116 cluster bacterium]|nr:putative manganese transporter [SAR116 cluster bacterium]